MLQSSKSSKIVLSPSKNQPELPTTGQDELPCSTQSPHLPLPLSKRQTALPAICQSGLCDVSVKKRINILLLGETGVGKSTFINAFANYLTYISLQEAENEKLICHIPTKFTVTDDDDVEHVVKLGEDNNECRDDVESGTQSSRCYLFPFDQFDINLIDTPGIGDTRGIEHDKKNMENILSFIGQYQEIHGICFLLKPNNAKITSTFEFCIKQLLCHLEKSASRNILFVFTNARGTFYKPGDTGPVLRKILNQVKSQPPFVEIKYDKENRFSLDNEAFRFLVAAKTGINFPQDVKEDFATSWEKSTKESLRIIEYIIGLPPHKVRDTLSVNEARRLINGISQPLADIAQNIATNLTVLKEHEEIIKQYSGDIEGLKEVMYIPIVDLELTYFDQPRTVCAGANCRQVCKVGDITKYHYPKKCHDPCHLNAIPKEIVGDPALASCAAMYHPLRSTLLNALKGNKSGVSVGAVQSLLGITVNTEYKKDHCMVCGCPYQKHMHIYYDTKEVQKQELDKEVGKRIKNKEQAKMEAENKVRELGEKRKNLSEKKEFITKTTAMFAHYLRNNAIAPYNDAFEKYVEKLIENQEALAQIGSKNEQILEHLRHLLKEHKQEKEILKSQLNQVGLGGCSVTTDMIFEQIRKLETIDFSGTNIADILKQRWKLVDKQQMQYSQIVHTAPIKSGYKNRLIKWGKEKLQMALT